jgi:cob(I)alamin adenosyltransferase
MKIYTKTGDAGSTGLFGGPRVSKADSRICAYGAVDELNSILGVVRASGAGESRFDELSHQLEDVQNRLFSIGAELACPKPEEFELKWIAEGSIELLERWIDAADSKLQPLKNFILPGGSMVAAHLHVARTVCRRVEREIVQLSIDGDVSDPSQIIVYLNRLSDYLFNAARLANHASGIADVVWESPRIEKQL